MSPTAKKHPMEGDRHWVEPKRLRGGGADDMDDAETPPEDTDLFIEDEVDDAIDEHLSQDSESFLTASSRKRSTYLEAIPQKMQGRWHRPELKNKSNDEDINLQWFDIDMFGGKPLTQNPNKNVKNVMGSSMGQVPVIRVYGTTEAGNSVAVFIHGYTPYGYFALPPDAEFQNTNEAINEVRGAIEAMLARSQKQSAQQYVRNVAYVTNQKSIMGYESPHTRFFKVHLAMPTMIPTLRRLMDDGVELPGVSGGMQSFQPFECNVPFVLRFMIDHDIEGASWLTLPKETYKFHGDSEKRTLCQVEVDISYNDIVVRKPEGEWSKIAPLRVLSLDIECQGRKGYFPEAEKDPVIQIANVLTEYGNDTPLVQTIFTLKGCLPIVGSQVITSEDEVDMLMKWREFLELTDPDVITGYNVQNFDLPYLLNRAAKLSERNKAASDFSQWGRIANTRSKMRESMFQSAAYGRRANIETNIEGRVVFDMLPYMQRNHKLSSYTLNSVCSEFLGQQKEDVHHSIISDLQNGSDEDRHRLAVYCLKDAALPQRLMDKLSVLVNYIEMARVTGVPMSFLISRGQQIKVFSMILRKCKNEKLLVPNLKKAGFNGDEGGYEGATVLEPMKSYYKVPIATLDFASLYPSIMQAYNLCYSTLVSPGDVSKLDPSEYDRSDNGHVFVKSSTKKGILPSLLETLLAARKQAKRDMKKAPTEFERAVQNGRQLALKVSANSVYGFTGATVGQLPCVPIASSVTSYGRILLEKTKAFVEEEYTQAHGYDHDAVVIYGDTDSVMVKFGTDNVKDTFPLAIKAAEACSKIFPSPILLEFEKVYFPYLLMNKKRYAGLMWTNPDKADKMDTKGLETVRRDNCGLVREVIQTSLDKILIDRDSDGAIQFVKNQISNLLQNKMDISRLVITKSLNKGAEYALGLGGSKEDYKVKQAHVELAARMKKRDAGSAPNLGDRVPYVIITGAKGAANFEKAEDPIFVLENNLALDSKWYLTNQLSKPLTRIFEPIIGEDGVKKHLLEGDHTRKIFIPTPSARKGSLMMFAVKTVTCVGCKSSLKDKTAYLCKYCAPREAEIYLEKLAILCDHELNFAKLWSAAQRIHGTVHSEIMCTGDGCACQFYKRKKVQADIKLALEVVNKFG